ncbi:(deoxy)nucleoside triphosphate pyrophosphohydrolase [Brumicola blandensis]|uniref:8-oxo-dGTP diphosphatase n=1 Tax=Brumicola blandensis TaxID=3075611 RepID=A0AAW8QY22_9ALTE|nr:(deoxy)nucleoside triphosphate pyrophosphohydrolase [Alteromonas sp. W409]MDT0581996.1 (deoxy)nucleoside triphosphate pyrophosphohydrolase [Alteromonas sp. W409]
MIEVVAAVIKEDGLVYCFKKGQAKYDYLSNKFEFPGGKVEAGEDHRQALRREINEELLTDIDVGEHLLSVEHNYPDFSIRLHFYTCTILRPIGRLTEHTQLVELPTEQLLELDWLPADVPAVNFLLKNAIAQ